MEDNGEGGKDGTCVEAPPKDVEDEGTRDGRVAEAPKGGGDKHSGIKTEVMGGQDEQT